MLVSHIIMSHTSTFPLVNRPNNEQWYPNILPVPYSSLAGNVSNMLATHRQRVKVLPILDWHACWCQDKKYPDAIICVGYHRQIVDTVVRADTVVHTARGANTVDKLNKYKLSGHVNVLSLVLPLVHWWCCCCCLFLQKWTTVSSTMVVAVAVAAMAT